MNHPHLDQRARQVQQRPLALLLPCTDLVNASVSALDRRSSTLIANHRSDESGSYTVVDGEVITSTSRLSAR
ncbi:MAG: hypothetical protein LC808_32500 [Actinobacteria bacterium]|nr:hypothetical protein [Actinomycetota bacterium]